MSSVENKENFHNILPEGIYQGIRIQNIPNSERFGHSNQSEDKSGTFQSNPSHNEDTLGIKTGEHDAFNHLDQIESDFGYENSIDNTFGWNSDLLEPVDLKSGIFRDESLDFAEQNYFKLYQKFKNNLNLTNEYEPSLKTKKTKPNRESLKNLKKSSIFDPFSAESYQWIDDRSLWSINKIENESEYPDPSEILDVNEEIKSRKLEKYDNTLNSDTFEWIDEQIDFIPSIYEPPTNQFKPNEDLAEESDTNLIEISIPSEHSFVPHLKMTNDSSMTGNEQYLEMEQSCKSNDEDVSFTEEKIDKIIEEIDKYLLKIVSTKKCADPVLSSDQNNPEIAKFDNKIEKNKEKQVNFDNYFKIAITSDVQECPTTSTGENTQSKCHISRRDVKNSILEQKLEEINNFCNLHVVSQEEEIKAILDTYEDFINSAFNCEGKHFQDEPYDQYPSRDFTSIDSYQHNESNCRITALEAKNESNFSEGLKNLEAIPCGGIQKNNEKIIKPAKKLSQSSTKNREKNEDIPDRIQQVQALYRAYKSRNSSLQILRGLENTSTQVSISETKKCGELANEPPKYIIDYRLGIINVDNKAGNLSDKPKYIDEYSYSLSDFTEPDIPPPVEIKIIESKKIPWVPKIILVGRKGCGKTCFVNALIYDEFTEENDKYVYNGCLTTSVRLPSGDKIKINLYEYSGQISPNYPNSCFFNEIDGFIVCTDDISSKGRDELVSWVENITVGNYYMDRTSKPFTVVITKSDIIRITDKTRNRFRKKCDEYSIKNFFETSAKNRENLLQPILDVIFQIIEKGTEQGPKMTAQFLPCKKYKEKKRCN